MRFPSEARFRRTDFGSPTAARSLQCVAIGRNYAAHIKELGNATPTEPFFFLKPTSSYALSADGKVEIPQGITCHHEGTCRLQVSYRNES